MRILVAAAVGLTLSGCVFQMDDDVQARTDRARPDVDRPAPVVEEALPPWDDSLEFVGIERGQMAGTIGSVHNFNLPTDINQFYYDGFFTQIDVYALRSDGRRAMIQLQVDRFGDGILRPGVGLRLRPGLTDDGDVVMALGCTGPDSGDEEDPLDGTDFDEEPCDVSIDTEQDPDDPQSLRVTLAVVFSDENGECPDVDDPNDPGDPLNPPEEPGEPGGGEDPGAPPEDGVEDPEDPFDDDGDCIDLPDEDGDGDGDLPLPEDPPPAPPPGDDPGAEEPATDEARFPLATSSFTIIRL